MKSAATAFDGVNIGVSNQSTYNVTKLSPVGSSAGAVARRLSLGVYPRSNGVGLGHDPDFFAQYRHLLA